jgi:hypothetical protein
VIGIYRALIERSHVVRGSAFLHLTREDAEATLCDTPRSALISGGQFDELVCMECVEWLPKRLDATAGLPTDGQPVRD